MNIFIFLLGRDLTPAPVGLERINAKEREEKKSQEKRAKKRKGIEAMRVKHQTPSRNRCAHGEGRAEWKPKRKK